MLIALPAKVYASEPSNISETVNVDDENYASKMNKAATALSGLYNATTNTIILQSDTKLSSSIDIQTDKPLTLDMNGYEISGGSIIFSNSANAPILLQGNGHITNCQIYKWGSGKLTLNGDITYRHSTQDILTLREGTTVIKKGTFYAGEKYVLWSDYTYENANTYLYIKGGNFYGNIVLSNCATYIQKGCINGKVYLSSGALYVQGGTIQKGICDSGNADDDDTEIFVSGGKILDSIVLDNGYSGNLIVSGGIIQSDKAAVIRSNVREGNSTSHANIQIKGGTIISTRKNGYGIKAINTMITLSGGLIKNTTKTGAVAVYNIHYNNKIKNIAISSKIAFRGFKANAKNLFKKNYCGKNVKYSLNNKGILTISGTGDMFKSMDFSNMNNSKRNIKIKKIIVKEGVTSIGGFRNCPNLKSVYLPSSVKEIYDSAFYDCAQLERIDMKSGIKKIGTTAFMYDKNLKEINMPDTITQVGKQAFDSCYQLRNVHLSNKLEELSECMFQHCYSLKTIEIPDKIKEIPYGTFYGCKKLSSVKLPTSLRVIGATAFIGCINLTKIEIPSTVTEIGRSAFKDCKRLENVKIYNLESKNIHPSAFANTPYKKS